MGRWSWWRQRRLHRLRGQVGMVGAILLCQALNLVRADNALATGRGYAWMERLTPDEHLWAGVFLGLGVLTLLGPFVPRLGFRILVVGTTALLLTALGAAFYRTTPIGNGWIMFGVPGLWQCGRLWTLLQRAWRRRSAGQETNA